MRCSDNRQFIVTDVSGTQGYHIAGDLEDFVVIFSH